MLIHNDRKLLKRLLKLCKGHQNILQCGCEPAVGECGTIYVKSPKELTFSGLDYFSFCTLLDEGYIELFFRKDHLYRLTAKAHRYKYVRRQELFDMFLPIVGRPIVYLITWGLGILSAYIIHLLTSGQ